MCWRTSRLALSNKKMPKTLCNFRVESEKLKKLKTIAKQNGEDYSKLIRQKIDEIIEIDKTDIKIEVIKLIKELKEPFAYVRTKLGKKRAKEIRLTRNHIIKKLEGIFNLKNGGKQ